MTLRPLAPLNTNYDPPRPWICVTHEPHECGGAVVGAVGAVPVCAAGAVAEEAAQARTRQRAAAYIASPEGQREIAAEQAWERRWS